MNLSSRRAENIWQALPKRSDRISNIPRARLVTNEDMEAVSRTVDRACRTSGVEYDFEAGSIGH